MAPSWSDYGIVGRVAEGRRGRALPYKSRVLAKTAKAIHLLERFFGAVEGRGYVSVSFGVDSLVAYDLARQVRPDVHAVWVNQGPLAEWPDCLALRDRMVSDGMHLTEIAPDVTLYDWYRTHGIPESSAMDSPEDKRLNEALMYAPLRRFQTEGEWRGHVWGLRADGEGGHRRILLGSRGELFRRTDSLWICSPVAWWSKLEVWAYIDLHGLPYPAMYDVDRERVRNGPPIGTSALNMGRVRMLRLHFPDMWRVFVSEFPEIARYS